MPDVRLLLFPASVWLKARTAARALLALAIFSIPPEYGSAVGRVDIEVGDMAGSDWSARDVSIVLELPAARQTIAHVRVKQAALMPEIGALRDLSIVCRNPRVAEPLFACTGATVSGRFGRFGRQQLRADVEYRSDRETLRFSIDGLKLAQGRVRVTGQWLESGWTLAARTEGLAFASLRELMRPWFALPEMVLFDHPTTRQGRTSSLGHEVEQTRTSREGLQQRGIGGARQRPRQSERVGVEDVEVIGADARGGAPLRVRPSVLGHSC